jgi:hypothetical protein
MSPDVGKSSIISSYNRTHAIQHRFRCRVLASPWRIANGDLLGHRMPWICKTKPSIITTDLSLGSRRIRLLEKTVEVHHASMSCYAVDPFTLLFPSSYLVHAPVFSEIQPIFAPICWTRYVFCLEQLAVERNSEFATCIMYVFATQINYDGFKTEKNYFSSHAVFKSLKNNVLLQEFRVQRYNHIPKAIRKFWRILSSHHVASEF